MLFPTGFFEWYLSDQAWTQNIPRMIVWWSSQWSLHVSPRVDTFFKKWCNPWKIVVVPVDPSSVAVHMFHSSWATVFVSSLPCVTVHGDFFLAVSETLVPRILLHYYHGSQTPATLFRSSSSSQDGVAKSTSHYMRVASMVSSHIPTCNPWFSTKNCHEKVFTCISCIHLQSCMVAFWRQVGVLCFTKIQHAPSLYAKMSWLQPSQNFSINGSQVSPPKSCKDK